MAVWGYTTYASSRGDDGGWNGHALAAVEVDIIHANLRG